MSKLNESNIILYLTYDGLADNIGQAQILPYLLGCSNKGFNFHVLSFEKEKTGSRNFKNRETTGPAVHHMV